MEGQVRARRDSTRSERLTLCLGSLAQALEHQLAIYRNFKEHIAPGGIYIIEDIADIDKTRPLFERIDPAKQVRILDRRNVKGRFDDVLVVITE